MTRPFHWTTVAVSVNRRSIDRSSPTAGTGGSAPSFTLFKWDSSVVDWLHHRPFDNLAARLVTRHVLQLKSCRSRSVKMLCPLSCFCFSHSQFLLFRSWVKARETVNMCGATRPVYVYLRFTHAGIIRVDDKSSNTKKAKSLEMLTLLGLVLSVLCSNFHSSITILSALRTKVSAMSNNRYTLYSLLSNLKSSFEEVHL